MYFCKVAADELDLQLSLSSGDEGIKYVARNATSWEGEVQVGELRSWLCAVVGDGSLVPGLVIAADEEVMADAIKLAW